MHAQAGYQAIADAQAGKTKGRQRLLAEVQQAFGDLNLQVLTSTPSPPSPPWGASSAPRTEGGRSARHAGSVGGVEGVEATLLADREVVAGLGAGAGGGFGGAQARQGRRFAVLLCMPERYVSFQRSLVQSATAAALISAAPGGPASSAAPGGGPPEEPPSSREVPPQAPDREGLVGGHLATLGLLRRAGWTAAALPVRSWRALGGAKQRAQLLERLLQDAEAEAGGRRL